jgi:hypothetical protein
MAPLTHQLFQTTASQERFEEVVLQGKALNSKAMTCIWTTPDQKEEKRQAATAQEWAKDIAWKTASGQTKNEQHDGYLERQEQMPSHSQRESDQKTSTTIQ